MEIIAIRVIDLYGLFLVLRCYLRLQRYCWIHEQEWEDEDES